MSTKRGIFSLFDVVEKQVSGTWSVKSDVWIVPSPYIGLAQGYGYVNEGRYTTTIHRIDFSNDLATSSPRGLLSISRYTLGTTSNSSFGWFGAGSNGFAFVYSSVDRINYSNDTATASVRGPLSATRQELAATGNSSYGWFGGGYLISTVERIDYANDTATASLKGPLSVARFSIGATGNSSFGYFGGGKSGAPVSAVSTVERIDYANDTATASPRGPLSAARYRLAATGNSSFGYFGGGKSGAPVSTVSSVDRIDYANDTATASPRGPLSAARYLPAATGTSSFGYFIDGLFPQTGRVDRIDYANDTATASQRGSLSGSSGGGGAVAPTANGLPFTSSPMLFPPIDTKLRNFATGLLETSKAGYFGGGYSPSAGSFSTVDRINYSNDTATASVRGPLSLARNSLAATGNSSYGWFGGGAPGTRSTVDRIDYSNDTSAASPKGPLSFARISLAATGNSSYGWFGGGMDNNGNTLSRVDRIDYSNDTAAASPRGSLIAARDRLAATGNSSYGWFGGGYVIGTGQLSSVDRIDYSNDTATASPRGPLSSVRIRLAATGNSSYGWFGGGFGAPGTVSSVDRIDYANDTATASPRGPLSFARRELAATGNSSFGYFGGGYSPSSPASPRTIVDRIDYANDTATASPRGPLSLARNSIGASSARANGLPNPTETPLTANVPQQVFPPVYGYFGGGVDVSFNYISSVERIDYTNDTVTASPSGPLNLIRYNSTATGNSSYGWFGGGFDASNTLVSSVERIDYSNDSATVSTRGPLRSASRWRSATGNSSYGWFGGGTEGGPFISTIDRIDYSNDTATSSQKGFLSLARRTLAATGNSSYGWFGGGDLTAFPPSAPASRRSTVDRIDYSNDTLVASPRGPLSAARNYLAATGNASYGWFGGGYSGSTTSSIINRIDYSNDTAIAPARGPFSSPLQSSAATGNSSYGWFGGGSNPNTGGTVSKVERVDYSNDTATASVRGPLSITRYLHSATSKAANGLT